MKILFAILALVATYTGRVVDEKGQPISYATVYPETQPEQGTATNSGGYFSFDTELPGSSNVIVSFIGYEKLTLTLNELSSMTIQRQSLVLKEQPIALEETVVTAKASKQRNKRKAMAALLHAVYVKLEEEFPDNNAQYQIVSDVRMLSENETWGMEQMIANAVVLPEQGTRTDVNQQIRHLDKRLRPLLTKYEGQKTFLFPVTHRHSIEVRPYDGEEMMRKGRLGVPEPQTDTFHGTIDLILVPGVAFDHHCHRIGRGGGYYDRFLAKHLHATQIGVCYDFQLKDRVPHTWRDKRVNRVVTPHFTIG